MTHPDGRLQRVRRNVPLPEDVRPGWQVLAELSSRLGGALAFESPQGVFEALSLEVPFYDSMTYEEIGGKGYRWQERDPGTSWVPEKRADGAPVGGPMGNPAETPTRPTETDPASRDRPPSGPPAGGPPDLLLGTHRDLWAADVTKRNPALRFLMPQQKLELAPKDAEQLELANGDEVTVSVNGSSVEARVAINSRMDPGAGFLIEGTDEQNANVLANGVPQRIEVAKR